MNRILAVAAALPLYKQNGEYDAHFPYLLIAIVTGIVIYGLNLSLNILQRKLYFERDPPTDVMDLIREIDSNESVKKEEDSTEEKKPTESLETRVKNSFYKSQIYGLDNMNTKLVKSSFMSIVDVMMTISGLMPYMYDASKTIAGYWKYEENEIIVSIVFLVINMVYGDLLRFPWDLYSTFVIEEKHGFNKQTITLFFKDLIKNSIINFFVSIPLYSLVIFILRRTGPKAYLYVWICITLFSIILNMMYPIFIMPLFNKMSPMDPSPLRDRIYELAGKIGFRVGRIQVIDSSLRTSHSNAAAYGFFGVNGILIYDTLLTQLTDDEILAVISHELGHWKHSHTYRLMLSSVIHMFALLFTANLFIYNKDIYHSFGFFDTPVLIGLLLFVSSIWENLEVVMSLLMNVLSRKYEYQADAFATRAGFGHELKVALTKLNVENSSSLQSHWLVSLVRHSHPSLLERCERITELEKKME